MISITTYRDYWKEMVNRIDGLEDTTLVANEAQLKNKLTKEVRYPLLVATVPSADPDSHNADNTGEKNSALIFVLEKVAASDRDSDNYVATMEKLQQIMKKVKEAMIEDFENCLMPMKELEIQSFHQDPEYNYLGHDGWSLSFRFATAGL